MKNCIFWVAKIIAITEDTITFAKAHWGVAYTGFDSCTIPIQQLYNNPSHEGGPQYVGPTLMWGIVVQLLYWCYKSNIFRDLHIGSHPMCLGVVPLLCTKSARITPQCVNFPKIQPTCNLNCTLIVGMHVTWPGSQHYIYFKIQINHGAHACMVCVVSTSSY